MTGRESHPIFWPFVAIFAMAAVAFVACIPWFVALCFTTPHRAVMYAVLTWCGGVGVYMLGLLGGMLLYD